MVTRTLTGRRILLALACLFAFATPASAECAWVLWNSGTMGPWDVRDTFQTLPQCHQGLESAVSAMTKVAIEKTLNFSVTAAGTNNQEVAYTTKDGKKISLNLRCLPDTVVPRGPKGTK